MNHKIIGVDIGGTTIKIGLLDLEGNILEKWEIPTSKSDGGSAIVADIWKSLNKQLDSDILNNILGIGIGAPGFVDGETGLVYEAVNIGWNNFQLKEAFSDFTNIPIFVENDANIAVLGENWKGAGNQAENLIAVTLGTGVGGGIVAAGSILNGVNGTAGEIGHITVDPDGHQCNCGKKGCLETIASATGIVRQAMECAEQNPSSVLSQFYKQTNMLTAKDIFEFAKNGDADCQQIIERTCEVLGFALANIAVIVNPSTILIGGGVSKAGDQLISGIKRAFTQYALPRVSAVCDIKVAELGNDAGFIGAAYLVRQKISKENESII